MSRRTRNSKTTLNADCTYTTAFGQNIHYESEPGRWEEVDLGFRNDGPGHVADRSDVVVKVNGARVDVTARDTEEGIRWLLPAPPAVSGHRARYSHGGLNWEYAVTPTGLKLGATVSAPRGPQTYSFPYQLVGGGDLTVDEEGDLTGDGFEIPRAFAAGADGMTYPASAWRLAPGNRVAFDIDDADLPAEAYPYVLDPTTSFSVAKPEDEGYVNKWGFSYPPAGCSGWQDSGETIYAMRTRNGDGQFQTNNGFTSWDTSGLPDDANVTWASMKLYAQDKATSDGRSLTADWYSAWPIDCNDFSDTAQTSAMAGYPIGNISTTTNTDIELQGYASGVSRTGRTGLRLHISGAQPAFSNFVQIYQLGNSFAIPAPQLYVTYSTPSAPPTIFSASDTPDPVVAGQTITFSSSWSDPNAGDSVRTLVCKTNSVTSTGLCANGAWAAGNYSTSSPSPAPYITATNIVGTNTYYAFACDSSGACSNGIQGSFTVTSPNSPPTISSASDSPDPVTAGSPVTFNVGWSDPNAGNTVRAIICKTNSVSAGSCPGGAWATGSPASTSPAAASYSTTATDVGTRTYYAFACDQSNSCSGSLSGTFTVNPANAAPSISSVTDSPDPVVETGTVRFDVAWSDPGDSVRAVICETNAISGGVCTGGGLASGISSQTSPSSVNYSTTSHDVGANTYYAFACDSSNVCSNGLSGTFTVNVAPTPPAPVLTEVPEDPTSAPTFAFAFTGTSGVSFECALTGPSGTVSPYAACTSPKSYSSSGLTRGLYTFDVRAVGTAGKRSAATTEEIAVNTGSSEAERAESPYEEEADDANAQALQFAGNRQAGSWQEYEADQSIVLHVAVAGMTVIDEVVIEALSTDGVTVVAERVKYAGADLKRFADAVTPVDKSRRYLPVVEVENNRVVVEVEDPTGTQTGKPGVDLGSSIPADAVEGRWVESVAVTLARKNTRSTFPPYKAGKRWGPKDSDSICGVAFAMTMPDGDRVGLTAGHCGRNGLDVYMGTNRGKFVGELFNDGTRNQSVIISDTALIKVPDNDIMRNVFIRRDFSRLIVGTDRDIKKGEMVCVSASLTGIHCGHINRVRENVPADGESVVLKDLWCTDINNKIILGDSGSAVYRPGTEQYHQSADEWTGNARAIGVVTGFLRNGNMCFEGIGQAETQRGAVVWDN